MAIRRHRRIRSLTRCPDLCWRGTSQEAAWHRVTALLSKSTNKLVKDGSNRKLFNSSRWGHARSKATDGDTGGRSPVASAKAAAKPAAAADPSSGGGGGAAAVAAGIPRTLPRFLSRKSGSRSKRRLRSPRKAGSRRGVQQADSDQAVSPARTALPTAGVAASPASGGGAAGRMAGSPASKGGASPQGAPLAGSSPIVVEERRRLGGLLDLAGDRSSSPGGDRTGSKRMIDLKKTKLAPFRKVPSNWAGGLRLKGLPGWLARARTGLTKGLLHL